METQAINPPRRGLQMPRDRRPEFKQEMMIKGRRVRIPKDTTKQSFKFSDDFHKKSFDEKGFLYFGFKSSGAEKAAARARGLIGKTDSENHEQLQKWLNGQTSQEVENNKGNC